MTRSDGRPTIGLLAGMGVRSTAPFLELLIGECRRQYGATHEPDYPPMIIFSWPIPFYHDRPVDGAAMAGTIREGLLWLERTGVDFITIPCNSAHVYFDEVVRDVRVPVTNMIEVAVDAIPKTTRRVALLATRVMRDSGVYQHALHERAYEVSASDVMQQRLDDLLLRIQRTADVESLREEWHGILTDLAQEADVALLACTDLNVVTDGEGQTGEAGRAPLAVVDGTRALAARTIAEWRSRAGV